MTRTSAIAVYGATGYTGRQVVDELKARNMATILVGRDADRLRAAAKEARAAWRTASLDSPSELAHAFSGASAVINCAGPFELSSEPVAAAAIAAGAHYLDFSAEQAPLLALVGGLEKSACDAGVAIVPGVGFYGGLGDLLASVTAAGIEHPTELAIAYAVERWLLTEGSRATVPFMAGRRWVWRDGRLELVTGEPRYGSFEYPAPRGIQPVMEDYPLPEAISAPRHIEVRSVRLLMTASTLREIFAPSAPAPAAVSDAQRAGSRFTVVAAISDGRMERRTVATGLDIYGITAPMIVGAAQALLGSGKAGWLAPSQAVDPAGFLLGLADHGLAVEPVLTRELAR